MYNGAMLTPLPVVAAALALTIATGSATLHAEPAASSQRVSSHRADRHWLAGLNLRTELGTHPIRADLGTRFGRVELSAVLDPMFWTDGQHDIDLTGSYGLGELGLAVVAGLRTTSIPLVGPRQWQHKLLTGASAPVDALRVAGVQATWGIELATVVVKHGGSVDTEWLSFAEPAGYLDFVNFAMYLRFDYVSP
jgi:hypothetical protein